MPISLNASFTGVAPTDVEFEHPEGAAIARLLRQAAQAKGWVAGDPDNWRDTGWSVLCSRASAKLECVIAAVGEAQWMCQVAPEVVPGLFGRALGKRPSASQAEIFELAQLVHSALSASRVYGEFRWRWDGPPNPDSDPVQSA